MKMKENCYKLFTVLHLTRVRTTNKKQIKRVPGVKSFLPHRSLSKLNLSLS